MAMQGAGTAPRSRPGRARAFHLGELVIVTWAAVIVCFATAAAIGFMAGIGPATEGLFWAFFASAFVLALLGALLLVAWLVVRWQRARHA